MKNTSKPFILTALLFSTATYTSAKDWQGEGTAESPYLIETGADLVRLSQNVNGGTDYEGVHFRLENELDLSPFCGDSLGSWQSIGSIEAYFEGVFNGNDHTISHLYIKREGGETYSGLFGYVGRYGRIEKLKVEGYIYASFWSGMIAGGNGGTISHCTSQGKTEAWQIAGGIVGGNFGNLSHCLNLATVESTLATGGVAGYNYGNLHNNQNQGEVYGSNAAGGIAGYNGGVASFSNCYNVPMGIVQDCGNKAFVSGSQKVGGIAGRNDGLMANCFNLGELSAKREVGGLAGCNGGFDGVDGFVYNSYNQGDVSCSGERAGGVVGINHSVGDVANVYNSGSVWTPSMGGSLSATNEGNINHSYSVGNNHDLTGEDNGFSSDCHTFAANEMNRLSMTLNQWVDEADDPRFAHWEAMDSTGLPVFAERRPTLHNLIVYSFHSTIPEDLLAFAEGEEVVLNVEPDPYYTLTGAVALENDTLAVHLDGNRISFVMPRGDVSLQLLWENDPNGCGSQPSAGQGLAVKGGKGELTITAATNAEVTVYSIDGRPLRRFDINTGETVRLKTAPGMYLANGMEAVVW